MPDSEGDAWEAHAAWWIENFTGGSDPVYREQILPLAVDLLRGCSRVLDVGCGDGQLGRALNAAGWDGVFVGVDTSAALMAMAASSHPGHVARGGAAQIPFADDSFDAVAVVLVLEHVADLRGVMSEIARVAAPGGRFVLFLNHPLFQAPGSGWVEDHVLGEAYWRVGDYLVETATEEEVDPGVSLPFHHRPLSGYVNAMVEAGFDLRRMIEPAPPEAYLAVDPALQASSGVPRLVVLVAELARRA